MKSLSALPLAALLALVLVPRAARAQLSDDAASDVKAQLEDQLRSALGLPPLAAPAAAPPAAGAGIEISIGADAQALMKSQGVVLDGDGQPRSATVRVDPNNAAVLVVTAVNKDGSRDSVRIASGRAIR